MIKDRLGVMVSPDALFDVQVKRIHEYKRQLLNIIEAVAHYSDDPLASGKDWVPRVKVFAGKAAPSYWNAKLIIKLINDVAKVINNDPARARSAEGGVPAQLQRVASPRPSSRPPTCPSRSRRPAWRPRAPAT